MFDRPPPSDPQPPGPQPPEYPPSDLDPAPEPGSPMLVPVALEARPAYFTRTVVVLILAVYGLGMVVGEEALFQMGAKINERILLGHEYYRLGSVMFLHAGPLHLAMNTYALWVFGQEVERFYGSLRLALIFVLGGLTASVFSLALTPGPSVGASGAVFAVFAAEMVLLYTNRALFGDGARQRLQSLIIVLILNAGIGIAAQGLIDNWAHLGGFLGGAVLSLLLVPHFRVAFNPGGRTPARLTEEPGRSPALVAGAWLAGLVLVLAWMTLRAG
jgi:rhomboid protease GluP